jgi:hypothetical protein
VQFGEHHKGCHFMCSCSSWVRLQVKHDLASEKQHNDNAFPASCMQQMNCNKTNQLLNGLSTVRTAQGSQKPIIAKDGAIG